MREFVTDDVKLFSYDQEMDYILKRKKKKETMSKKKKSKEKLKAENFDFKISN